MNNNRILQKTSRPRNLFEENYKRKWNYYESKMNKVLR